MGLAVGVGQCHQESICENPGGVSLGDLGAEGGLYRWDRSGSAPLEDGAEELHVARLHVTGDSEYTAGVFRQACQRMGICQSMGRPGSALDNAVIESWHSTLEFELRSLQHFAAKAEARAAVAAWIEDYNHNRRHTACQKLPPVAYEQLLAERGKEAA